MGMSPSIRKPSLFSLPLPARRRASLLTLHPSLLPLLRTVILVFVFHQEYYVFAAHVHRCRFPTAPSPPADNAAKPFQILVVADPQLLDMRSYPGRGWALRKLGVWFTDAYMRKVWRFIVQSKSQRGDKLDAVVWLGDLLDSGVESVDRKEHSHYVHRFHLLFPLPIDTPQILLPGNHDLGLHLPSSSLASYARERFASSFDPTFGEATWGGWHLVWVDAMALLEDGAEDLEARRFVEQVGEQTLLDGEARKPTVLLSHIPLFRPEGTECGAGREHQRGIYQGTGRNYQNELDEPTSEWLLRSLGPTLVYSGDDHDACTVVHAAPSRSPPSTPSSIHETTVKSLSMAMGVRNPGYTLLSLSPPPPFSESAPPPLWAEANCVLPDQLDLWLGHYIPTFLFLVVCLLLPKLFRASPLATHSKHPSVEKRSSSSSHRHHRSLSQKLFGPSTGSSTSGGGGTTTMEDEDEDPYVFPTFPFESSSTSSSSLNAGYLSSLASNFAGLDEGTSELPFSYSPSGGTGGDSRGVRRVSRVWSWDRSPSLGPARLASRARERGWRSVVALPVKVVGAVLGNQVVRETVEEVWKVVGWGVGLWVLLWVWFAI